MKKIFSVILSAALAFQCIVVCSASTMSIELTPSEEQYGVRYSFEYDGEFALISFKAPKESGKFVAYSESGCFEGTIPLELSKLGGKVKVTVSNLKEKALGESTLVLSESEDYTAAPAKYSGKVTNFQVNETPDGLSYSFSAPDAQCLMLKYHSHQQDGEVIIFPDSSGNYSGDLVLPYTYSRSQITVKILNSKGSVLKEQKVRKGYHFNEPAPPAVGRLSGITVCIDPGHQENGKFLSEPLGPGLEPQTSTSFGMAQGKTTLRMESIVTLEIAMALRDELLAQGANVVMTRTEQMQLVTNLERSAFANDRNADIMLRLHCDLRDNTAKRGMSVYAPLNSTYARAVAEPADYRKMGEMLINSAKSSCGYELTDKTGFVHLSDQFVGNNWAKMIVFLVEMGMMSNTEDDYLLSTPQWQQRIASGLAEGVWEIAQFRGLVKN